MIKIFLSNFKKDFVLYKSYSSNKFFDCDEISFKFLGAFFLFLKSNGFRLNVFLRFSLLFSKIPILKSLLQILINFFYSSDINLNAYYGPGIIFQHPFGIVIGQNVKILGEVVIFNNITIGKKYPGKIGKMPEIGKKNIICSGSRILGSIKTGENCVISSNSVLTENLSSNCTYFSKDKIKNDVYFL